LQKNKEPSIFFVSDNQLFYRKNLKEKTKDISLCEDCSEIFSANEEYQYYTSYEDAENAALFVLQAPKSKKDIGEAICINTSIEASSLTILKDASLLYIKNDSDFGYELYHYFPKENKNEKLSVLPSASYTVNKDESFVYYTDIPKEDFMQQYRIDLTTKEKKLLSEGYGSFWNNIEDEIHFYCDFSEGTLKAYNVNTKEEILKIQDVYYIENVISASADNLDFYYSSDEGIEYSLYDLIEDDCKEQDNYSPTMPKKVNLDEYKLLGIGKINGIWKYQNANKNIFSIKLTSEEERYFGITQMELNNLDGTTYSYDWYRVWDLAEGLLSLQYQKAQKNYESINGVFIAYNERIALREALKNESYIYGKYNLHHYKNGEDTILAKDFAYTFIENDAKNGFVIVRENAALPKNCCKLSEISSVQDVYSYIKEAYDCSIYLENMKTNINLDGYVYPTAIANLDEKRIAICLYYEKNNGLGSETWKYGDDYKNILQIYDISTGTAILTEEKDLPEGYSLYGKENWKGEEILLFEKFKEDKGFDIFAYQNDDFLLLAENIERVQFADDHSMLKSSFMDFEAETADITYISDKEKTLHLGETVKFNSVYYLGNGKLLYCENGDLIYYNGKEKRIIAQNVTAFNCSGYAALHNIDFAYSLGYL